MDVVLTAVGALVVVGVLRDVFHTLFHPSGRGELSAGVFRVVWRVAGRTGGRRLAGPLAMMAVILLWVGLLVLGWALVYWPALPGGFVFAPSLDAATQDGLVDALYFSIVTQSTVGYGDIAPQDPALRVLAAVQAGIGFGVFTLVVTWVLSVYPALQRQRSAAGLAHALREVRASRAGVHPTTAARQLERAADALQVVRVDLVQYPSTFYFSPPSPSMSLAEGLPIFLELSRAEDLHPEAAASAAELAAAVRYVADAVATHHLGMHGAEVDDVLDALRRHHGA